MENYLTAFFLLLKSVLSNSKRVRKRPPGRYLLLFVCLNILVATKWKTGGKRHSNWNFVRRATAPMRTKFVLKSGSKRGVDGTSWVKKQNPKDSGKRKNIVLINRGVNRDENRISYTRNNLQSNSSVREIKHLSNLQRNVIYLLERNNNILVHAKTSSGKTTICLLYLILKFYYNAEFVFEEDIEREKYMSSDEYLSSYREMLLLNQKRNKVHRNKLKYTPFSEKYAQICDIRQDKDLLMEGRAKNVLKKGEKILILCPSKELCVQISQNVLSLMSGKDAGAIRLFIDKEGIDDKRSDCVPPPISSNYVGMKANDEAEGRSADIGGVSTLPKRGTTNDSSRATNLRDPLFLIGTPICFKNFLLSLSKEDLKAFLQSIKYVFFDEIDRMFPAIKTRKSRGTKNSTKKKTAYFILETIMYMNKKNLVFVGCSSTLNRELHRRIFKLLSLNRNNAKKKIYLLREGNSASNGGTPGVGGNPAGAVHTDTSHLGDSFDEPPASDPDQVLGEKSVTTSYQEKGDTHMGDYSEEDERAYLFSPNGEHDTPLKRYIIKVRLPQSIRHLYSVVKDQLYSSKMEEAYKIVEHFKNSKVLILVKNGCSLLSIKRYLSERNIFSVLLHEELQISLTGNNDHLHSMCEQYAHIKDLKETVLQNEEEAKKKYVNKYPIIISSFDSIRGFHINNLELVLLCSRPKNVNEYIHLSGRVGRRNNVGYSILLEDERNVNIVANWLTNIQVRFFKLALKGGSSTDAASTGHSEQVEKSEQNGPTPPTDRGRDSLNYITSCIMDELNGGIP
ncbi:hypothetical protein PVBG_04354 [Plasmodium vivax Brazil I]|uniref:ATP-dependent RNA helicase n=1 Tax=Plasmodium vivax (strain Brazil I) TaxID=1033975 RepID=A0A0J9VEL3_PLAV1|nr:hypothetical protein PVBG_00002 [Plasmodium vivax Brazil I]KMZ84938.1 hypothetical protein PVBG_04354 [Plasmodium vivax Brazil I]